MKKVVIFTAHKSQSDFLASVLENELASKRVKRVEAVSTVRSGDLLTVTIVGDTEVVDP